ncbi:MAG: VWA domain-containing protein [gamma proteobacterium symbiont of Taylorina sp.]|nr:VWA domain-containing protein [gamma proteobacterium symbiont of Taylorina sp.]
METPSQNSDIRVLIDVSGSMKKNDPKNLRLPALRLLVGLLPPDSTASAWNFGTNAKLLVPLGSTDEKWKETAHQASKKIHSKDLFTNIGKALDAAIADWDEQTPDSKTGQRSIILLTDGMVDISKNDKKNNKERNRILTELLPKIEKTGAQIHTIALSKNADHDFLKQLSTKTDGGYEQTDNAEQLERIFLRLFEKTTQRDTVPLVDNKFLVDESILELTLLVFKTKDASPTIVIEPDKNSYQQNNKPGYVKWQSENNYDLVTITRPKVGEWSINAQTDPDNRVMVVTNLQIQTARIPNNIFIGETLNIALFLTDDNKIITDDNFLQFTSISAMQIKPVNNRWFLHDNGLRGDKEAHDGIYNVSINKSLSIGKHQFTLQAKSETFQREVNYSLLVHDINLINTRVIRTNKNNKEYHQILVTPNIEFIRAKKLQLSASLMGGGLAKGNQSDSERLDDTDNTRVITLEQKNPKVLEWTYKTNQLNPDKDYYIIVHLIGKTRNGRAIDYVSKPIQLNLPKFKHSPITAEQLLIDEPVEPAKPVKAVAKEKPVVITPPIEEEIIVTEESFEWLIGIVIAIIANIILGIGGWIAYRKWKQNRDTAYEDITGELE